MPRSLGWRSLSGGLVSLATILLAAFLVLVYARVGKLHGKIINLYIVTQDAQGIIGGSEVWLSGQKVGLVKSVAFQGSAVPRESRLILHTHLLANVTDQVRVDSRAQIRSGGTMIGDPVVYLRSGSPGSRAVRDGDTLHVEKPVDLLQSVPAAKAAAAELPLIIANIKDAARDGHAAGTRIAQLTANNGAAAQALAAAAHLRARIDAPNGSAARLVQDRTVLATHATRVLSAVDTLRTLLATQTSSIGRFRRDSSLILAIAQLRDTLAEIGRLASDPKGSAGRLRADNTLIASVDSARAQMAALFADMKAHPLRYLYVF